MSKFEPERNSVVAVSTAVPTMQMVYGRDLMTSIVRDPTAATVHFDMEGPENNRTAVHTEHVLAFSAAHYDYWTAELGIDRAAWNWCHWGENLTLADADEASLFIGQRIRIGETAIFEITSPRIPCFKLSWRLGQPESILKRIIETGRIGIYLRVVAPGDLKAGDAVRIDPIDTESISVADLSRLLAGSEKDVAQIEAVLRLPALGTQARGMLQARLNLLEDQARGSIGRWQGWRPFVVARLVDEADGIRSFYLAAEDGEIIPTSKAGQHLTVEVPDRDIPCIRSWSLSHYDHGAPSFYRLSIKAIEGGRASNWMLRSVSVGDTLRLKPPTGRFVLNRGGFRRIVLISAGIGVTPMLAMLQAFATRGMDAGPLIWIHVTRNARTHAFAEDVDRLLAGNPRFQRHVFYSAAGAEDGAGWFDHQGRLSPHMLREILAAPYETNPFGRAIELPGHESEVYICGPADFEGMTRRALSEIGVADHNIQSEQFAPPAGEKVAPTIDTARIRFTASGKIATWNAEDNLTLLELAEVAGLKPECSCRIGSCGTCEVRIGSGEISYIRPPSVLPETGKALLCSAVPASATVEIDI